MASISALNISGTKYDIFAQSALWAKSGTNFSANSINVNGDLTANTINSNELVINGAARVLGTLYADTIEGKITSAVSADNADKLDGLEASVFASASDVSTLKGYFNNGSAKSADKATSATTSNVARTLTATISANYSSLSAGSAKLAGTATSASTAYFASSAQTARNGNFYEETFGGLPAAFDETKTYAVNDKVLTGSYAYSASAAVSTAGEWSAVSSKFARLSQVTWTLTDSAITGLYKGLTIWAKIPSYGGSSGSNATMLNVNNSGAKQVRINNSNYTTHYAAGTIIHMVYDGTYWQIGDRTDGNTDTKVNQTNSTTNNYRPVVLGYTNNATVANLTASAANQVYTTNKLYYKSSDGSLYNNGNVNVTGTLTATTVSGTTVSATSALVTSAKVNTGNILSAYGSSAKFDSISATNITGTVLEKGKLLPASANLNDYKNNKRGEVSWYNYASNGTEGNRPENGTSVLQVIKKHDGDYVDQNVYVAGVTGYYWHRSCNNGTWSNWVKNVYSPTIDSYLLYTKNDTTNNIVNPIVNAKVSDVVIGGNNKTYGAYPEHNIILGWYGSAQNGGTVISNKPSNDNKAYAATGGVTLIYGSATNGAVAIKGSADGGSVALMDATATHTAFAFGAGSSADNGSVIFAKGAKSSGESFVFGNGGSAFSNSIAGQGGSAINQSFAIQGSALGQSLSIQGLASSNSLALQGSAYNRSIAINGLASANSIGFGNSTAKDNSIALASSSGLNNSFAILNSTATTASIAIQNSNARDQSIAIGGSGNFGSTARYSSITLGVNNKADHYSESLGIRTSGFIKSIACGADAVASADSLTLGSFIAAKDGSIALGTNTEGGFTAGLAADYPNKSLNHSFLMGLSSYANHYSFVMGNHSTADYYSYSLGNNNSAYNQSVLIGDNLLSNTTATKQIVIGEYNVPIEDAVFIVGNGISSNRRNSFFIRNDGEVCLNNFYGHKNRILYSDNNGAIKQSTFELENLNLMMFSNYWTKGSYDLTNTAWHQSFSAQSTHYLIPTGTTTCNYYIPSYYIKHNVLYTIIGLGSPNKNVYFVNNSNASFSAWIDNLRVNLPAMADGKIKMVQLSNTNAFTINFSLIDNVDGSQTYFVSNTTETTNRTQAPIINYN